MLLDRELVQRRAGGEMGVGGGAGRRGGGLHLGVGGGEEGRHLGRNG